MATPTPNNPSNPGTSNKSILDARAALKELIEDQGDYNNLLRSASQELDRMQKSYNKIAARIDSLNKGSINLKEVNRELNNLKQKEYIAGRKVADLEAGLSKETQKELKNRETLESLLKKATTLKMKERVEAQIAVNEARLRGNIELQNLDYHKKMLEVSQEERKSGEIAFENEKKVSKQLGISGNLMKIFADKIGVGEEAYNAMTFAARKTVDANGKVTNAGKWKVLAAGIKAAGKTMVQNILDPAVIAGALVVGISKAKNAVKGALGSAFGATTAGLKALTPEGGGVVSGLTGGISSMAKNIPFIGGMLSGLIDGFSALLDVVVGVDDAIVKAGRNLGMTSGQARQLNRHFQDISFSGGNVFVTSKKLLESFSELAGQLEVNNRISDATLQTNIMLKDFAGLELETRSKLAEVSTITGKSTQGVVKNVLAQVKGLERATGVQFNYQKILKEVTSLSGVLGLTFSKYPAQLTKSLLTIKAMGMDMKQLDSMADSFLDFESSVTKEMEAQILTGKEINLNKARELFLNNDLAGAAAEINKHVGSSADFLKMNRLQAQSLAEAMGMSRDQMADMLQKQEMYSKLGAKGTENAREMYQLALKKYGTEKEMAAALGDQAYQTMVQASTQEKLMALIEKIKQGVIDFVERSGIIEKIEGFVNMLTDPNTIRGIIKWVRDAIAGAIEMVSGLIGDLFEVVADLPFTDEDKWMERASFFKSGGMAMANRVRSVGGNFGATSVNTNMMYQSRAQADAVAKDLNARGGDQYIVIKTMLDGQEINQVIKKNDVQNGKGKIDGNRIISTSG